MVRRHIYILCVIAFLTTGCGDNGTGPSSVAWSRSGVGNDAFTKPAGVVRVRITGNYSGVTSNFVVWCGPSLLVNELLGTGWGPTSYSGTHATPNCTNVEVRQSTGVSWQMTEVP